MGHPVRTGLTAPTGLTVHLPMKLPWPMALLATKPLGWLHSLVRRVLMVRMALPVPTGPTALLGLTAPMALPVPTGPMARLPMKLPLQMASLEMKRHGSLLSSVLLVPTGPMVLMALTALTALLGPMALTALLHMKSPSRTASLGMKRLGWPHWLVRPGLMGPMVLQAQMGPMAPQARMGLTVRLPMKSLSPMDSLAMRLLGWPHW
jgi:hypothetical protein